MKSLILFLFCLHVIARASDFGPMPSNMLCIVGNCDYSIRRQTKIECNPGNGGNIYLINFHISNFFLFLEPTGMHCYKPKEGEYCVQDKVSITCHLIS